MRLEDTRLMSHVSNGTSPVPCQAPIEGIPPIRLSGHLADMLAGRIAENISHLRESRGWSRPELGRRCRPATSGSQIERLEKGERKLTVEWIERLAAAFNLDPAELIAGESQQFTLTEQVADEVALRLARFVLRGDEPHAEIAKGLSILIQDLSELFARNPEAYRDPVAARIAVDFLTRPPSRPA